MRKKVVKLFTSFPKRFTEKKKNYSRHLKLKGKSGENDSDGGDFEVDDVEQRQAESRGDAESDRIFGGESGGGNGGEGEGDKGRNGVQPRKAHESSLFLLLWFEHVVGERGRDKTHERMSKDGRTIK